MNDEQFTGTGGIEEPASSPSDAQDTPSCEPGEPAAEATPPDADSTPRQDSRPLEDTGCEGTGHDSSISGRLEAMLRDMAEGHPWKQLEERVLESIDRIPPRAETALSSWIWWLMLTTGIGVVLMGWLRTAEITGWQTASIETFFPVLGNSLLTLSALGLIWAGSAAVSPRGEDSEFGAPTLRWLIIGSGWTAALVGALVAFLPAARKGQMPPGTVPFIVVAAVSGLVASWALELRHQGTVLTVTPDSMLRRVSVAVGILLILVASVLQVYFLVLH